MPKGEHFKKPNPRIHQVSFKLNATELSEMKRIVAASGKSLPEFLRNIIFNSEPVIQSDVAAPVVKQEASQPIVENAVEEKVAPVVQEAPKPAVEAPKVVKKERDPLPKHEPRKDDNNQFSLF